MKRDDLSSPVYGGTKVRGLEFLLGRALAEGSREVVTLGASGSHHVAATALFARRLGLGVRAVLFPQPPTPEVEENRRLLPALGAEIHRARTILHVPIELLRATRARGGMRPHWVPPGGTSPLGILGAAEGYLELADAVECGAVPKPDLLLVAAGSCGTAAGLLLGRSLSALHLPIAAVRVTPRIVASRRKTRRLARAGARLLRRAGARMERDPGEPEWIGDAAGSGYARPTDEAEEVAARIRAHEAFRVETTYTAKTLAVLLRPRFHGLRVLYWNTLSAVDATSSLPASTMPVR